jgi:hypothetical protein
LRNQQYGKHEEASRDAQSIAQHGKQLDRTIRSAAALSASANGSLVGCKSQVSVGNHDAALLHLLASKTTLNGGKRSAGYR